MKLFAATQKIIIKFFRDVYYNKIIIHFSNILFFILNTSHDLLIFANKIQKHYLSFNFLKQKLETEKSTSLNSTKCKLLFLKSK
jgi:late competence protein required for DNA uptake (superfamily II DNA/RNA helicase)